MSRRSESGRCARANGRLRSPQPSPLPWGEGELSAAACHAGRISECGRSVWQSRQRSTDLQSAVSRNGIPQALDPFERTGIRRSAADSKSAIRQTASLRYDLATVCPYSEMRPVMPSMPDLLWRGLTGSLSPRERVGVRGNPASGDRALSSSSEASPWIHWLDLFIRNA